MYSDLPMLNDRNTIRHSTGLQLLEFYCGNCIARFYYSLLAVRNCTGSTCSLCIMSTEDTVSTAKTNSLMAAS